MLDSTPMTSAEEQGLRASQAAPDLGSGSDLEGAEIAIKDLPALPEPHRCEQLGESLLGCTVVLLLIGLFVGLTHGVAVGAPPYGAEMAALVLIYAEMVVALLSLGGLLFGDPGVVKRSPETCYPIPRMVLVKLRAGEPLHNLGNISQDEHTYCIRCLVWRPEVRIRQTIEYVYRIQIVRRLQ